MFLSLVNKSTGADGISAIMLKHTAHAIAPSLTCDTVQLIFNYWKGPQRLEVCPSSPHP